MTGELDVQAVLHRRDQIVHCLDDSAQLPWLEDHGIVLIRGHARLEAERRVRVGETVYEARRRGRRRAQAQCCRSCSAAVTSRRSGMTPARREAELKTATAPELTTAPAPELGSRATA